MFLEYDQLVKYNSEVNWDKGIIQFTKYLRTCKTKYQDIIFKTRKAQTMNIQDKKQQKIRKKPNPTNLKDFPKDIQPFIYLFNKKKFEKLLERQEQDYKINMIEEPPKELNTKAYAMIIKEGEALNQQLDEQLKTELIIESSSRYTALCFYIPKKDGLLQLVQDYQKLNQYTIKDKILLPLIGEVIDKLKEMKYFNKLNLIWRYNNI